MQQLFERLKGRESAPGETDHGLRRIMAQSLSKTADKAHLANMAGEVCGTPTLLFGLMVSYHGVGRPDQLIWWIFRRNTDAR